MELEEAYQQQLHHWRATLGSGAMRIGWKIGLNAQAVQEQLGITRSAVGHLTTATLIGADKTHSLAGAEKPVVEPELAIVVGREGTIQALGPALEVADMGGSRDDPGQIVATNIFHRAVAIGTAGEHSSADGVEAVLSLNGEVVERADAGATDLGEIVALVDETLRGVGESLDAGDRIIAGALTTPPEVTAGDRVELDLGPIGRLEIDFT